MDPVTVLFTVRSLPFDPSMVSLSATPVPRLVKFNSPLFWNFNLAAPDNEVSKALPDAEPVLNSKIPDFGCIRIFGILL
jgi:hypothetical protein